MKDIKIGDYVRHNYGHLSTIEIFKVGKIEDDKIYNEYGSVITQNRDYVYSENCTLMTAEQKLSSDIWNDRLSR
jgi:hypothetical protein